MYYNQKKQGKQTNPTVKIFYPNRVKGLMAKYILKPFVRYSATKPRDASRSNHRRKSASHAGTLVLI
jgi:hypothetical protein